MFGKTQQDVMCALSRKPACGTKSLARLFSFVCKSSDTYRKHALVYNVKLTLSCIKADTFLSSFITAKLTWHIVAGQKGRYI